MKHYISPIVQNLPIKNRVIAASRKIHKQFPPGREAFLIYSVFLQALKDAYLPIQGEAPGQVAADRCSAVNFLLGKMEALIACDVDPDWAREQIKRAGMDLEERKDEVYRRAIEASYKGKESTAPNYLKMRLELMDALLYDRPYMEERLAECSTHDQKRVRREILNYYRHS